MHVCKNPDRGAVAEYLGGGRKGMPRVCKNLGKTAVAFCYWQNPYIFIDVRLVKPIPSPYPTLWATATACPPLT